MNMEQTAKNYVSENYEQIKKRLTGRNGGLRPSKPNTKKDNGLIQYVWRWARFNAGHDVTMPVMSEFDLREYFETEGFGKSCHWCEDWKITTKYLDSISIKIVQELGLNGMSGTVRWGRALGYL